MTQSRGVEEIVAGSPSSFGEHFRNRYRCRSNTSGTSDENSNSLLITYQYQCKLIIKKIMATIQIVC